MSLMWESTLNTIKKYQAVYKKDPHSKIFAPLAEAYRKNGQIDYAFSIALKGVQSHPDFASGRVSLARVFMAQKQWDKAIEELKQAIDLNPEILLAYKLLGESYLELRQPQKSLEAYKMALYLDPVDEKARLMVKKLEQASHSDSTENNDLKAEANKHLIKDPEPQAKHPPLVQKTLAFEVDRKTSLIDAFISRRDYARAMEYIDEAIEGIGKDPQLLRRKKYLEKRFQNDGSPLEQIKNNASIQKKVRKLKQLQAQIEKRRIYTDRHQR